jgi:hypothetical protein
MGWDEDFLRSAVNTCTNLSGQITDCPLFTIQDSSIYGNCNITEPAALASENVLNPVGSLPGNVPIASGPAYAKSAVALSDVSKPAAPVKAVPAPAPATATMPAGPSNSDSSTTTKTRTTTSTSFVTVSRPPPPPTSSVSYYSTQYLTTGQVVNEVLWVEDVVTVTEQVTATVSVYARDHLHKHQRFNHH